MAASETENDGKVRRTVRGVVVSNAMDKTIVFPIAPVDYYSGGPRAVVLLSIALVASLVHGRLRR